MAVSPESASVLDPQSLQFCDLRVIVPLNDLTDTLAPPFPIEPLSSDPRPYRPGTGFREPNELLIEPEIVRISRSAEAFGGSTSSTGPL